MWVSCCHDVNELIWSWCSHCLEDRGRCLGPWAFRAKWGLWLVCCLPEGAGFPSPWLGNPGSELRAALEQRGGEPPFAGRSCLCSWRSKGWFQESKTRKVELLSSWEVLIIFKREWRGGHECSPSASAQAARIPFQPDQTVEYSGPLSNTGRRDPDTEQSEMCVELCSAPLQPRFLCIHSSTSMDSTNLGSCSNIVFTMEKNPCVSGPMQLIPVLFKSQLYLHVQHHLFFHYLNQEKVVFFKKIKFSGNIRKCDNSTILSVIINSHICEYMNKKFSVRYWLFI